MLKTPLCDGHVAGASNCVVLRKVEFMRLPIEPRLRASSAETRRMAPSHRPGSERAATRRTRAPILRLPKQIREDRTPVYRDTCGGKARHWLPAPRSMPLSVRAG